MTQSQLMLFWETYGIYCWWDYWTNHHITLSQINSEQIQLSKTPVNKYFFWLKNGREAICDAELLEYFIYSGGAEEYRKRLEKEMKR